MATSSQASAAPVSGLPIEKSARYHFDIYAILEAPQELYFGSEVAVNINLVETVKVMLPGDTNDDTTIEKCYISPTKRRGVERRMLIWAPRADGTLLGDFLGCGIPGTCCRPDCPICSVYGGLITDRNEKSVYLRDSTPHKEDLKPTTYMGRLTHGGGVAVQAQEVSTKQRAMHPSRMHKEEEDNPMPFRREYNQPALLYPVYNHCLSITDAQFEAIAYAFLNVLPRIGAGNPKGVRVADGDILGTSQPLLVVDRYRVPLGARPVISPAIIAPNAAISSFVAQAVKVRSEAQQWSVIGVDQNGQVEEIKKPQPTDNTPSDSAASADQGGNAKRVDVFTRWIGAEAMQKLEECALSFTKNVLLNPLDGV